MVKPTIKSKFAKAKDNTKLQSKPIKQILPNALYLVATPIGNLGDITKRAIEIFTNADLILAEDTRVTRKLCSFFGIENKIWRADEEATPNAIKVAIETLQSGGAVAFAPDAGTPSISDPGQRLAAAVIDAGFEVYAAPGASSVLNALSVSGFDVRQFAFLGFVPNKSGARKQFLSDAANLPLSLVMFETAPRLIASLKDMLSAIGNRNAMVSRELTKMYEEKKRGSLGELLLHYEINGAPKGEIVIVIERAQEIKDNPNNQELETLIIEALKTNSVKDAASLIAKQTGLNRKALYELALKLK